MKGNYDGNLLSNQDDDKMGMCPVQHTSTSKGYSWSNYDGNLLSNKCGYWKIITFMFSILLLFMIMIRVTTTMMKMISMLGSCKLIVWV